MLTQLLARQVVLSAQLLNLSFLAKGKSWQSNRIIWQSNRISWRKS
jgi:hypothetical protein